MTEPVSTVTDLTDLDRALIDGYQREFPLTSRPYLEMAESLGVTEAEVLDRLAFLKKKGVMSRAGAVFKARQMGDSSLAAMAIPPADLEKVAERVNAIPEVNHNYERENRLNLWFVITAPSTERLEELVAELERDTGLAVLLMPMVEEYRIDLAFPLKWPAPHGGGESS